MRQDIRWIQRLNNWTKALEQLTRFISKKQLNELEEQGLIQSFEYNHELAWKTQKDFLQEQGVKELFGSRNVAKEAFNLDLITDADVWMLMIEDRNLTSHTYNKEVTTRIIKHITKDYYQAFCQLHKRLVDLAKKENG